MPARKVSTNEELDATVAEMRAQIDTLRTEVGRCQSMIQEQSVELDRNRREFLAATNSVAELNKQLEIATARAERLQEQREQVLNDARALAERLERQ